MNWRDWEGHLWSVIVGFNYNKNWSIVRFFILVVHCILGTIIVLFSNKLCFYFVKNAQFCLNTALYGGVLHSLEEKKIYSVFLN